MTDTSGNETPIEGELPEQTVETPADGADSAAGESGQDAKFWQDKYLAAKGAEERANAADRRIRELEERQQPSPAAFDAGASERTNVREQQIIEAANSGELWAQTILEEREQRAIMARDSVTLYKLNLIPDPALREEIRTEYATNRPRYTDIEQARTSVESRKKDVEIQRLQAELKRAAGSRPPPDTVRTVTKEVFASERNGRIKGDDLDGELAKLRAQGRHHEANTLSARYANQQDKE